MKEDRRPIFDEIDPAQIELDCASPEPRERVVRFMVRSRYGDLDPVTLEEVLPIRDSGFKSLPVDPSPDLLRLARAIMLAEDRANESRLPQYKRILRQNEVDALKQDLRYLLNAEAGEKYCVYDLGLFACGPVITICAKVTKRK